MRARVHSSEVRCALVGCGMLCYGVVVWCSGCVEHYRTSDGTTLSSYPGLELIASVPIGAIFGNTSMHPANPSYAPLTCDVTHTVSCLMHPPLFACFSAFTAISRTECVVLVLVLTTVELTLVALC
jgi:hypothetical protein